MINPDNQRMMAARMKPVKQIELDASLASRPAEVTARILVAVKA